MIEAIPILPSSYLSHSVITTVWIGVMVIAFFNLRFGWIFTGLVVPGYLTPLLLIKPLSVLIILVESVVTYQIIYIISELAGRRGLWTNFFGRDRFFAILLMSVFVRLFFDGWALPWLNNISITHFDTNLNVNDSLHSFGLIIVALIANYLYKPKLISGLFQLAVTLGITYIIVRFIFINFTNFSLSNISYLYEDIAGSIMASPKSYIILLITAFVASRMNLFYGWDFNGIMVPSLLALQWYQPTKIAISFFEAYVILFLSLLVLKLPIIRNMTMEGARKVVLFFNVGFFYKIAISIVIVYYLPDYKVSDYFGFGYLLSTLIAIKIHEKVSMPLFTRATLQTSIVSIFIATVIGYSLTILPRYDIFYSPPTTTKHIISDKNISNRDDLIAFLGEKEIDLYKIQSPTLTISPTPSQLDVFDKALELIDKDYLKNKTKINTLLNTIKYQSNLIQNHYLVLSSYKKNVIWGMYVIDINKTKGLIVELPHPISTPNLIESAIVAMFQLNAKVLSISGEPLLLDIENVSKTYTSYYTLYQIIHKHYLHNGVLEISILDEKLNSKFKKDTNTTDDSSFLFFKGTMPKYFNLSKIKNILPKIQMSWQDKITPDSIQKKSMHNNYAQLFLKKSDVAWIISTQKYFQDKINKEVSIEPIEGLLEAWVLKQKLEISKRASQKYIKPSIKELLFFDKVIFTPILELIDNSESINVQTREFQNTLLSIAFGAKSLGYTLTLYKDKIKNKYYLILHENKRYSKKYWGTYVFKLGQSQNIMIQTPRPFYESNTFEYSLELFSQLNAKALLLSGTHPFTNINGSSDVMRFRNRANIFNLASQIIFRESKQKPMNALQIRGRDDVQNNKNSATLAFHDIFEGENSINKEEKRIYNYLKKHIPLSITDGGVDSAGYDALALQSLYLSQSVNNTFNILWLPSSIRKQYQQISQNSHIKEQFIALNIPIIETSFVRFVKDINTSDIDLAQMVIEYIKYRDINELHNIKNLVDIKLLIDDRNAQGYILLYAKNSKNIILVAKLNGQTPFKIDEIDEIDKNLDKNIKKFYLNNSTILKMDSI